MTKQKILLLDDNRSYDEICSRNHEIAGIPYDLVKSFDEFKAYIEKNGIPAYISFDIDLKPSHYKSLYTEYPDDGIACVRWLINKCIADNKPFPKHYFHTMNLFKREVCLEIIDEFNYGNTDKDKIENVPQLDADISDALFWLNLEVPMHVSALKQLLRKIKDDPKKIEDILNFLKKAKK